MKVSYNENDEKKWQLFFGIVLVATFQLLSVQTIYGATYCGVFIGRSMNCSPAINGSCSAGSISFDCQAGCIKNDNTVCTSSDPKQRVYCAVMGSDRRMTCHEREEKCNPGEMKYATPAECEEYADKANKVGDDPVDPGTGKVEGPSGGGGWIPEFDLADSDLNGFLSNLWGSLWSGGNASEACGRIDNLGALFNCTLTYIIFPAAGFALFLMILWGAYKMVNGSMMGSQSGVEAGRRRIIGAILGFLLLAIAYWLWRIVEIVTGVKITG